MTLKEKVNWEKEMTTNKIKCHHTDICLDFPEKCDKCEKNLLIKRSLFSPVKLKGEEK